MFESTSGTPHRLIQTVTTKSTTPPLAKFTRRQNIESNAFHSADNTKTAENDANKGAEPFYTSLVATTSCGEYDRESCRNDGGTLKMQSQNKRTFNYSLLHGTPEFFWNLQYSQVILEIEDGLGAIKETRDWLNMRMCDMCLYVRLRMPPTPPHSFGGGNMRVRWLSGVKHLSTPLILDDFRSI
ncbi:hypothetical protein BDR03DRAFT_985241 [Suillus americanus]|nr:hypothetical protein BDR03DRAFT_985241 [Suillus americanus]